MKNNMHDVLILGGGPAGLTAAIYTSRAYLDTLVAAGNPPGGQLTLTTDVENYPAFPNGIMGPKLIDDMRKQAKKFGTRFENKNISHVSGSLKEGFMLKTEDSSELRAKVVVVATGASALWLGLESEQKLRGKGVSACATCDGFFFKDKEVAVVGGGDSAMEESLYLTKFASKVYVLVRKGKDGLRASKIMQKRAVDNKKIEFMFHTEVEEVLGQFQVEGLKIFDNQTHKKSQLGVEGLFIAIGHKPNTAFLEGFVDLDERGYVKAKDNVLSSREGVLVAGDVADPRYRQAVTAAGFGCMAAIEAEKLLAEQGVEVKASTSW